MKDMDVLPIVWNEGCGKAAEKTAAALAERQKYSSYLKIFKHLLILHKYPYRISSFKKKMFKTTKEHKKI